MGSQKASDLKSELNKFAAYKNKKMHLYILAMNNLKMTLRKQLSVIPGAREVEAGGL